MRARAGDFLQLGEVLAEASGGPVRLASLLQRIDAPRSTAQTWLRQLRFQQAIIDGPKGTRIDRLRLLQVMSAHRLARITPLAEVPTSLGPQEISGILGDEGIGHALAMLSAANEWAFFEPRREMQVYVSRAQASRLPRILPRGERTLQVFGENVASLQAAGHVKERGNVRVTCPFLTVVDCRAHPEGGAHADFLERNVLRWRTKE